MKLVSQAFSYVVHKKVAGHYHCTQEKYEDKLDFYILALWIAHL